MDNYKRLIELARGRFGEAVGDDIPDGDLYFLMDGGKNGNQQDLSKPFASKPKSVKVFTLWRDEDSMTQRLQRVRGGIATNPARGAPLHCQCLHTGLEAN